MFGNNLITKSQLILYGMFFLLISAIIILFQSQFDATKIVFCDVGQGDAIYIRTKSKTDILVDAGKSNAVLYCLGKNMPFFDRKIEYVFISHPQADHYGGLLEILNRYRVDNLSLSPLYSDSQKYKAIIKTAQLKNINITTAYAGQLLTISPDTSVKNTWPTKNYVAAKTLDQKVLGVTTLNQSNVDPNDFSQVLLYKQGNFDLLLTGDISAEYFERMLEENTSINQIEILKVPHHGSVSGLNTKILNILRPDLAIISVGNNSYGHPSRQVIDLLHQYKIKYLTTKDNGTIILSVTDNGWQYFQEK